MFNVEWDRSNVLITKIGRRDFIVSIKAYGEMRPSGIVDTFHPVRYRYRTGTR